MFQRVLVSHIQNHTVKLYLEPAEKCLRISRGGPEIFVRVPGLQLLLKHELTAPYEYLGQFFICFKFRDEIDSRILLYFLEVKFFFFEGAKPVEKRLLRFYDH